MEPLNRYETYFLNRTDQALALADEVGYDCGIAFDPFHLALEEGLSDCRLHVADNNRQAAEDGSFDWPKLMSALADVGYNGGLAVECIPPIDRTAIGHFGAGQLESESLEVPPEQLQFLVEHGSGVLSDSFYTGLLARSAKTLRPFLC